MPAISKLGSKAMIIPYDIPANIPHRILLSIMLLSFVGIYDFSNNVFL